jgi:hypothetical protein
MSNAGVQRGRVRKWQSDKKLASRPPLQRLVMPRRWAFYLLLLITSYFPGLPIRDLKAADFRPIHSLRPIAVLPSGF